MREYFKKQEDDKIHQECTFNPKINESSQWRFYFYQSSAEEGSVKNRADVVKRNELWKESKQKKLELLKKEQEEQIKENWPFTPRTTNDQGHHHSSFIGKSNKYGDKNNNASRSSTPNKVNNRAIEKFVHRQELARWLKEEKEIYESKLKAGSIINHSSMKEINNKKNDLIKELSLPSNEDFTGIYRHNPKV